MSKPKTHVLVPYTTMVACGQAGYYITPGFREDITCKVCRKSVFFKLLPNRK